MATFRAASQTDPPGGISSWPSSGQGLADARASSAGGRRDSMGANRECRCSCDSFALIIRIFSLLSHLASGAAGGWGFILAAQRFSREGQIKDLAKNGDQGDIVKGLTALNSSQAIFQGIMSVYFCTFAILGIFSELRNKWTNNTVLLHLGFLKTYIGRAAFMIYVGAWVGERADG